MKYSEIKIDRNSPEPLFWQIASELRRIAGENMLSGPVGLPSERKLAALLGVDRSTVNKAFDELSAAGLITRTSPRKMQWNTGKLRKKLQPFANVGIILPGKFSGQVEEDYQVPLQYFKGIIDRASEKQVSTIMITLPDANTPSAKIDEFIAGLSGRLAGIIHLGDRSIPLDSPLRKLMRCEYLPQVIISADTKYSNIMQILPDIRPGVQALAARLKKSGLKSVGVVSPYAGFAPGNAAPYFAYSSFSRAENVRNALIDNGIDCNDKYHLWDCMTYQACLKNLLLKIESGSLPDVYWCHNDEIANWFHRACEEAGLQVPENISIVGFDGVNIPGNTGLATIKMPFYEIGVQAFDLVWHAFENGNTTPGRPVMVNTGFIDGTTLKNQ